MINVRVRLFARLRELFAQDDCLVQVELGETIKDLKLNLVMQNQDYKILDEPGIMIALNHQHCSDEKMLNDGDEVAFFPPITGG